MQELQDIVISCLIQRSHADTLHLAPSHILLEHLLYKMKCRVVFTTLAHRLLGLHLLMSVIEQPCLQLPSVIPSGFVHRSEFPGSFVNDSYGISMKPVSMNNATYVELRGKFMTEPENVVRAGLLQMHLEPKKHSKEPIRILADEFRRLQEDCKECLKNGSGSPKGSISSISEA